MIVLATADAWADTVQLAILAAFIAFCIWSVGR